MFKLFIKDFVLVSKIKLIILAAVFVLAFMGVTMPLFPGIVYVASMILLAYILVGYADGYDDKYKSQLFLNSLPINRADIVRAKYTNLICYIFLSGILIMIFTIIIKMLGFNVGLRTSNPWDVIIAFNIIGVFFAFYYPAYFKFGGEKLRILNTILYVVIFVLPSILTDLMKKYSGSYIIKWLVNARLTEICLIAMGAAILILAISLKVSESFYLKREF